MVRGQNPNGQKPTEFSEKRTKAHPKVDGETPNNSFITLTSEDA